VVDLTAKTVTGTVDVQRGPRGISINSVNNKAYVTNQDAGTVSVIDLTNLAAVPVTITLDANARPSAIQVIASLGVALIPEPSAGPTGKVLVLNLTTETFTSIAVNQARPTPVPHAPRSWPSRTRSSSSRKF
jgi:YVTN family beta-propeller protein